MAASGYRACHDGYAHFFLARTALQQFGDLMLPGHRIRDLHSEKEYEAQPGSADPAARFPQVMPTFFVSKVA